jgi:hypothetical protein
MDQEMRRPLCSAIGLATAMTALLAFGHSTPSEAFSASSKDVIEIDLTGFTKCFDYVTLAGKPIAFKCGDKASTVVDKGSTGKTLSFSGRWSVVCQSGTTMYSNPYTYNLTLQGEGYFSPSAGPWVRSPCPEKPYNYFGGDIVQHNTPYASGIHFGIRMSH